MKLDQVIFREYDIRGVYDEQFDDEFAYHLGRAFAAYTINRLGKRNFKSIVFRRVVTARHHDAAIKI